MLKPRHHCFCLAVRLYLEINTGAPRDLGELGRRAIYFQGAGLHWKLFQGFEEQTYSFGAFGSPAKK